MSHLFSGLQIRYLDTFILQKWQKHNPSPTLILGMFSLYLIKWKAFTSFLGRLNYLPSVGRLNLGRKIKQPCYLMISCNYEVSLIQVKSSSILMVSIAFLLLWKQKQNLFFNITHALVSILRSVYLQRILDDLIQKFCYYLSYTYLKFISNGKIKLKPIY